ncbi:MAG: hypothetical protein LKG23_10605 [Nitrospira sp.]|jgi:LmbE family N-acetylglucosaminyl deacetylase|nr:hypothetical protein [Nitrospira sp.]
MVEGVISQIVIAVCHPDDEALWVGGVVHALSQFPSIEVSVICLSGKGEDSVREKEFFRAKQCAGYSNGIVLGGKLRAATEPLPHIPTMLESGLNLLGVGVQDISLLITHSPYGDEHMHPHHMQACVELYEWSGQRNIPFGYFSCLPMPTHSLQSLLTNMKRAGALHILNFSRCKYSLLSKALSLLTRNVLFCPKYYMQFLTDMTVKQAMLTCYQSINLKLHEAGYAMFTSNCESIYVFDDRGLEPFRSVMNQLPVPGSPDLFSGFSNCRMILRRSLKKLISRKSKCLAF